MLWIDYEAYEPLAREGVRADCGGGGRALAGRRSSPSITAPAASAIGEASVVIAAASPHRADAFAACRYAIERVKQIAPIWKHEHFEGGEVWIEGATADPDGRGGAAGGARARMLVTVRLFARLRELAGAAELTRRSCPTRSTRCDAWHALIAPSSRRWPTTTVASRAR